MKITFALLTAFLLVLPSAHSWEFKVTNADSWRCPRGKVPVTNGSSNVFSPLSKWRDLTIGASVIGRFNGGFYDELFYFFFTYRF